jgi:elongation factor G
VEAAQKGPLIGAPCVDFRATVDFGSATMPLTLRKWRSKWRVPWLTKRLVKRPMPVSAGARDEGHRDNPGRLHGRHHGRYEQPSRKRVSGMDSAGKNQVINAEVPLAEFQTYAPDLRSMTGGRGMYAMEFLRYDEVPAQIATKVIEQVKAEQED